MHQALGRVLGRALGRQIIGDEEEAPQRRRLTTSARRQQAIIVVAKDIDHVDHVADEVHEEPHEPIMDHVGVDMTEGFSGGP